jgi:uncharacterized protein YuzE
MKEAYLEVTYRKGRLLAAYLYLPRNKRRKSVRTRRVEPGLIIDLASNGDALGIEITAPSQVSASKLNRVLRDLGVPPLSPSELSPLRAA